MDADTAICIYFRSSMAFMNNGAMDGSGRPSYSFALATEINNEKCTNNRYPL